MGFVFLLHKLVFIVSFVDWCAQIRVGSSACNPRRPHRSFLLLPCKSYWLIVAAVHYCKASPQLSVIVERVLFHERKLTCWYIFINTISQMGWLKKHLTRNKKANISPKWRVFPLFPCGSARNPVKMYWSFDQKSEHISQVSLDLFHWSRGRPVTSLGHQGMRRVFWAAQIFKLCPTHFSRGACPHNYGPVKWSTLLKSRPTTSSPEVFCCASPPLSRDSQLCWTRCRRWRDAPAPAILVSNLQFHGSLDRFGLQLVLNCASTGLTWQIFRKFFYYLQEKRNKVHR